MVKISCTNCRRSYPEDQVPYRCPFCGGVYDFETFPVYDPDRLEGGLAGIWRYRQAFGLSEIVPVVSLGEGATPLVWDKINGQKVGFKLEYLNPSGSFKDRGTAVMVSFLLSRGIKAAVEDSSGNAGASFAAYAARSGIQAQIFIPDYASGPKRAQIEAYGAKITRIMGPRSNTAQAVRRAAENGKVYASHAYLPHGLAGLATAAYEIVEQVDREPGTVILPVGQGSFILGIGRGFMALREAGVISKIPKLVGVQARACAPLWALFMSGPTALSWVPEGETAAEGIRIRYPVHGDAVYKMVAETSEGIFVAVDEEDILPGQSELARRGFFVEPTSAVVWSGLSQVIGNMPEPVIVILTGSGFKSID